MTNYDHDAIRKAYPNVFMIDDDTDTIVDANGDVVAIDQTLVDAARVTLDNEFSATEYIRKRTGDNGTTDTIYLPIEQQLDMQYWDAVNGTTTWKDHIAAVKAKYPKPS